MKTRYYCLLLAGATALGAVAVSGPSHDEKLVVHEWGTFTSLQGSDGLPMRWNPLESSRLPKFVYSWNDAGLGRFPTGLLALGQKSALVTLQRMETPVIYFYTDKPQTVDVAVRFPKGGITEWYPQAPQIGPSVVRPGPVINRIDAGLHHCGVPSNFSLDSLFDGKNLKESIIHWADLKILPSARASLSAQLPVDSSGSHYFSARETDSAFVQAASFCPTNSAPECEKFLFYRGAGNFSTPLSVSMPSEGNVSVANAGSQVLSHLFLLGIAGNTGTLVSLDPLRPGDRRNVPFDAEHQSAPLSEVRRMLQANMVRSLTDEGLFPREAKAMVNTWADSWFQEQGARVLYILPRAWTDQTLPMTINPKPRKLVRVMVGRAELITSTMERQLTLEVTQAAKGDGRAKEELREDARKLGRFAGPVFEQALARTDFQSEELGRIRALVYETRTAQR